MKTTTKAEVTDTELRDEHVKEWKHHQGTLHLPRRQPKPIRRRTGRRGHRS